MTVHSYEAARLASDLVFPECPRWHDDALWFSDMEDRMVRRYTPGSGVQNIFETPCYPGGLGWRSDGALLTVLMQDQKVLRTSESGAQSTFSDLSHLAAGPCNDMIVTASGRCYLGTFGYDIWAGDAARPGAIIMVEPDGLAREVATDLSFPNGFVMTTDGSTLIVAESYAHRLSAFPLAADGSLGPRTVWADLGDQRPDGIVLDPASGAIWVALPRQQKAILVKKGGEVIAEVVPQSGTGAPLAVALGGRDGETLFLTVCAADQSAEQRQRNRSGTLQSVRVRSDPG